MKVQKPPRAPKAPKAKTNAEETSKKENSANGGDIKEGKYPEIPPKMTKSKKEIPPEKKQDSGIGKRSDKHNGKLNLESPDNPVDKKTARWIEEQNEFLGKQKEKGSDRDKKERDAPTVNPNGPVKVLQWPRATYHTGYERSPQHLVGAQGGQVPQPPMVVTNQRNGSWGSQGKRYPLKERPRNQWGGYGKQYGTSSERGGYQTYRTDRTQPQSHNTAYESQRQGRYLPTKGTGSGQGGNGENGDENDKKKYRDTRISQESDSHEESDTEDSYDSTIESGDTRRGGIENKTFKEKASQNNYWST